RSAHESAFLKEHAGAPFKITVPNAAGFVPIVDIHGVFGRAYATPADLLRDLVQIVSGELRALADEGVPYVQLDAPGYTRWVDQAALARIRQNGVDPDAAFAEIVAADNACLVAARRGVGPVRVP